MTDKTSRLNWSTLRHLAKSAKLLKYRVEHPREDTPALKLGRAIHCAILEPESFESRWISVGSCAATKKGGAACNYAGKLYHGGRWYCGTKGHAPGGAVNSPEGFEVITADERALALTCAESVKAHKVASGILDSGHAEESIEWTDEETGIACRGRVDLLKPSYLVDLKSTRRETLREITMDVARNLYHAQLAWYHDGSIAAGRLPADAELPRMVAVSTSEPYDVAPFKLSRTAYEAGQIKYRDFLTKYEQCQAAGWWPGIAPDLETLELPVWAGGMQGSEEGIGNDW